MEDIIDLFHSIRFKNNKSGKCKVYIDYNIDKTNIYIGYAGTKDWFRPVSHWNDLLYILRSKDESRFCYSREGLSKENARVLEAFLILYGSNKYGLSKYKATNIEPYKLINKRRERRYEKLIRKTLIIDGNYDSSLVRGKTDYC